ncbi:MAG TPA: hypothetical protein VGF23_07100 [Gaiellaceae bacterium]
MTASIGAGVVLAVGSAVAINGGYALQHQAASRLPPLTVRRPVHSLLLLFGNGRWTVGFFAGIGGWVLYVAALRLAPLSIVQACAAGGIGVLALLAGRPPTRLERLGVAASLVGLALLALSLAGKTTTGHGSAVAVAAWMAVSVAVAGLVAGTSRLAPGAALGVAAGVLYAAGDVGTKAAVAGGLALLFVPALLACHGLAFVSLQLGFQRGGALATAGLATLWTNALPIAAGTVLFGEGLPDGAAGVARLVAFGLVVAGAVVLAAPEPASVAPCSTPLSSQPSRR